MTSPNQESTVPILSMADIRAMYSHCNSKILDILQFFANEHLSPNLQVITRPIIHLAFSMVDRIGYNPELVEGLRWLLISKDSFVRSYLLNKKL